MHFPEEIQQIEKYQRTGDPKHRYVGKLRYLNPILEQGILRVGGRIKHANLTFAQRHPVILPSKHHVTKIIIDDLHEMYLHIGPSGLLSLLRQRFWILDGRNRVQQHLRKCVRCFKANPTKLPRYMGDLPAYRVTRSDVFSRVGVDYAGPFSIKTGNPRKPVIVKGYIALFVCLSSKAIHMEMAVDLSSQAFINVLKRFVSRRRVPTLILSDNATNFIRNYISYTNCSRQNLQRWPSTSIVCRWRSNGNSFRLVPLNLEVYGKLELSRQNVTSSE